jgi:hypothetical protein
MSFSQFSVTPGNGRLTANWTWTGPQTRFIVFIDLWPISETPTPTDYGSPGPNSQTTTTLPPHFGGGPLVNGVTYRVDVHAFNTSDPTSFVGASDPIFIAPEVITPYIYIRPVVTTNTIRYNWEVSTLYATNFTLTCTSTDGGAGGGTVVLGANAYTHTFTGLTYGKTYEAGLTADTGSSPVPSSFYRTVTTGDPPDPVQNVTYTSTPTTISFAWEAPAGVQTPPIGWYYINDTNTSRRFGVRYYTSSITIPFNQTPHLYYLNSVSDTGYSSTFRVSVPS